MIQRTEARRLASSKEWSLISSSLSPALKTLSVARLKSKIVRAGKFRQKYRDLYRRQELLLKSRPPGRPYKTTNIRTKRKRQMFDEAIDRLKLQLGKTSSPAETPKPLTHRKSARKRTARLHPKSASQRIERRNQSLRGRTASPALPKAAKRRAAGHIRRHSHVAASARRKQSKRDSRG
jgi:hypothetical protein